MLFISPQGMDIRSVFRNCYRWGAALLLALLSVPGRCARALVVVWCLCPDLKLPFPFWPARDRRSFRTSSFKFLVLITRPCSALRKRSRIYVLMGLSWQRFALIGSEPFISHAHTWQWSHGRCHCWQGAGGELSVVLTGVRSCNPDNHSRCRHHGRHSSWMPPNPPPGQPPQFDSLSPNPQGIEYPPNLLSCCFSPLSPSALSFESAAHFWPLLLERV